MSSTITLTENKKTPRSGNVREQPHQTVYQGRTYSRESGRGDRRTALIVTATIMGATVGGLGGSAVFGVGIIPGAIVGGCMGMVAVVL